jgi:hypothetical protein
MLVLLLLLAFIAAVSAIPVDGGQDLMKECGLEFCNITNQYCDTLVQQCKECAPLCARSDDDYQSSCLTHCEG